MTVTGQQDGMVGILDERFQALHNQRARLGHLGRRREVGNT